MQKLSVFALDFDCFGVCFMEECDSANFIEKNVGEEIVMVTIR